MTRISIFIAALKSPFRRWKSNREKNLANSGSKTDVLLLQDIVRFYFPSQIKVCTHCNGSRSTATAEGAYCEFSWTSSVLVAICSFLFDIIGYSAASQDTLSVMLMYTVISVVQWNRQLHVIYVAWHVVASEKRLPAGFYRLQNGS